MRFPPIHVVRALKRYDKDLGLRWDQRRVRFMFTWRGRDIMPWLHRDGTPALADLPSDEAVSLMQEADNRNNAGERMRRMNQRLDAKRDYETRENRAVMGDAGEAAKDHARMKMRGGPRPFVTGKA